MQAQADLARAQAAQIRQQRESLERQQFVSQVSAMTDEELAANAERLDEAKCGPLHLVSCDTLAFAQQVVRAELRSRAAQGHAPQVVQQFQSERDSNWQHEAAELSLADLRVKSADLARINVRAPKGSTEEADAAAQQEIVDAEINRRER